MDTSEKYILMCSKAQEIQKLWNRVVGDFYYENSFNGVSIIDEHKLDVFDYYTKKRLNRVIWLPRQDQLQEMVSSDYDTNLNLLYNFESLFMDDDDPEKFNMHYFEYSFEQLWLTFVMMEKFNKKWSEEHEIWYNA